LRSASPNGSGLLAHAIACVYFAVYYSAPNKPFHYDGDNLLHVIGYLVEESLR